MSFGQNSVWLVFKITWWVKEPVNVLNSVGSGHKLTKLLEFVLILNHLTDTVSTVRKKNNVMNWGSFPFKQCPRRIHLDTLELPAHIAPPPGPVKKGFAPGVGQGMKRHKLKGKPAAPGPVVELAQACLSSKGLRAILSLCSPGGASPGTSVPYFSPEK